MENPTAFDLTESLGQWRDALKHRPAIRDEDIEELESHLRDTMGALLKTGLTEPEAFLVAAHRVGPPVALEEQFNRARPAAVWKERAQWMILGILSLWAVSGLARMGSILTLALGGQLTSNGMALGWIALVVHSLLLIGAGWVVLCYLTRSRNHAHTLSGTRLTMPYIIIALSASAAVFEIIRFLLFALVVSRQGVPTYGGFLAVTGWGISKLTAVTVIAVGLWLAKPVRRKVRHAAALLLVPLLLVAGCKPGGTQAHRTQGVAANPAENRASTELESCLALMNNDTNAAVEKFLSMDLATAKLFSSGTPLSYSEIEFAKLPQAAMEKIGEQAISDLALVKQLVRGVKARSKDAAGAGNAALAAKCNTQLLKLADRLEGSENLKITQLVGKAVRKTASE